jgi:hypothetical protein
MSRICKTIGLGSGVLDTPSPHHELLGRLQQCAGALQSSPIMRENREGRESDLPRSGSSSLTAASSLLLLVPSAIARAPRVPLAPAVAPMPAAAVPASPADTLSCAVTYTSSWVLWRALRALLVGALEAATAAPEAPAPVKVACVLPSRLLCSTAVMPLTAAVLVWCPAACDVRRPDLASMQAGQASVETQGGLTRDDVRCRA